MSVSQEDVTMDEPSLFDDQLLATKFFVPSPSHPLIPRLAGAHQYPGEQHRAVSPRPGRLSRDHRTGDSPLPHLSGGTSSSPTASHPGHSYRSRLAALAAASTRGDAGSAHPPVTMHA